MNIDRFISRSEAALSFSQERIEVVLEEAEIDRLRTEIGIRHGLFIEFDEIGKYCHYGIMTVSVINQVIIKEFAIICMPDVKIGLKGRTSPRKCFILMHVLA